MSANIGQAYEQIKAIDGFPYNRVGETWVVNNIQGKYIVLKNDKLGLGVDEAELKEYFKLNPSYSDYDYDDADDSYDEEDEEEVVDDEVDGDDEDIKEVGKLKSFLRKIGLSKN